MSVVLVSPNNRLYSSLFLDTVSRLKNVKTKCFHSDIVNVKDESTLSEVTKRIFEASDLHVVVVIGEYKDQDKFMERYLTRYDDLTKLWILSDYWLDPKAMIQNIQRYQVMNRHLILSINQQKRVLESNFLKAYPAFKEVLNSMHQDIGMKSIPKDLMFSGFFVFENIKKCLCFRYKNNYHMLLRRMIRGFFLTLLQNSISMNKCRDYTVCESGLYKKSTDVSHNEEFEKFRPYSLVKCPNIQICRPGSHKFFGEVLREYTKWNYSYGWTCKKCPVNTMKSFFGDGPCRACISAVLKVDENQTNCFDPYNTNFINITDSLNVKICMILSAIGICFALPKISVFIMYRDTPVCRMSNFELTLYHMFTLFASFIVYAFVFIGKPDYIKCIARPLIITVFSCNILSVILVKSQTLLFIFQSKRKLEKNEVFMEMAKHIFLMLMIVAIGIIVQTVTLLKFDPQVVEHLDKINFRRDVNCNTEFPCSYSDQLLDVFETIVLDSSFSLSKYPRSIQRRNVDCLLLFYWINSIWHNIPNFLF